MTESGRHRHKDDRGMWVTSRAGEHGHPQDPALTTRLDAIEARIAKLEPPIVVDPPPSNTMPVGGDPARRGPKPVAYRTPDATVTGTALADMKAAEDKAGVGGLAFVPAGVYPAPPGAVAGVRWQLDPNAIWSTQFKPTARDIMVEGGEMRGGAWLGIWTDAHGLMFHWMRIRNVGIFNESRSGLFVLGNDFQNIPGECVRLWYDSPAHKDVQGVTIMDNVAKRTSYSVNGVGMFTGNDGGGQHKLFNPVVRNNATDNGADKGQGPGGLGAFATYELWGCVNGMYEYNDMGGGGFLNSNVRDQDGIVRWNRGRIEVGRAWAFWESGGTGAGGTKLYENEIIGDPARNGVIIATAAPNPVKPVEVTGNRYSGCRTTSDPNASGYSIHDNPIRGTTSLTARLIASPKDYWGAPSRQAPGE